MENPNKYIRKYFFNTLNSIIVQGQTVKVYDSHTPNNDNFLIILSTQTGSEDWQSKCSIDKNRSINLDVIVRKSGNVGSRAMLDDIVEEILSRCKNIEIENFKVQYFNVTLPNDLSISTSTETIYRQIINFNFNIK